MKNEQCESILLKGVPLVISHITRALACEGGYLWPTANGSRDMLHTSNTRFEPSQGDPRMVEPDWAIADSYGPARA